MNIQKDKPKFDYLILICLAALWSSCASAQFINTNLPYHPYRKVGSKYYNLSKIYEWVAKKNKYVEGLGPPPLSAWRGASVAEYPIYTSWVVDQVVDDGLIIHEQRLNAASMDTTDDNPFFLTNYPSANSVAENQKIRFLALRNGVYRYTDTAGASRTIECWDYGTPITASQFIEATSPRPQTRGTNAPPNRSISNSPVNSVSGSASGR